jgi:hypothetical protein
MFALLFLLLITAEASNRLVVHYKNEELAKAAVSVLRQDKRSAQISSVDRSVIIWDLSPDFTIVQARVIMEIFRLDPNIETVEQEITVYPTN